MPRGEACSGVFPSEPGEPIDQRLVQSAVLQRDAASRHRRSIICIHGARYYRVVRSAGNPMRVKSASLSQIMSATLAAIAASLAGCAGRPPQPPAPPAASDHGYRRARSDRSAPRPRPAPRPRWWTARGPCWASLIDTAEPRPAAFDCQPDWSALLRKERACSCRGREGTAAHRRAHRARRARAGRSGVHASRSQAAARGHRRRCRTLHSCPRQWRKRAHRFPRGAALRHRLPERPARDRRRGPRPGL